MVKSMLDLRQLETFGHKKNGSCHDKESQVRTEPRQRGEGAAVCAQRRDDRHFLQPANRAKRHQPWSSLHSSKGIRDPDGAERYSEENEDDASLRGR